MNSFRNERPIEHSVPVDPQMFPGHRGENQNSPTSALGASLSLHLAARRAAVKQSQGFQAAQERFVEKMGRHRKM
jgi:hypothetical protein